MSKRQNFVTDDQCQLLVGARPAAPELRNLVKNPDGLLGAWGWLTPSASTQLASTQLQDAPGLENSGGTLATDSYLVLSSPVAGATDVIARSEPEPVTPGQWVKAQARVRQNAQGSQAQLSVRFLDAAGAQIGSVGAPSIFGNLPGTINSNTNAQAPAGAAFAQLQVYLIRVGGAATSFGFDNAMLSVVASQSAGRPAFRQPYAWTDVMGPTHVVNIDRPGSLQLGMLKATILDATLDPSASSLIRPGAPVRAVAYQPSLGKFQPLFCGEVLNGTVQYDLTHKAEAKRARIELSAVDVTKPLANAPQPAGVKTVAELAYLVEGVGVPWRVNKDTRQLTGAGVQVSVNENASVLDQVAITRDTTRGAAFVSRFGQLVVADSANRDTDLRATFTESEYLKDVAIDFDMSRVVNEVTVKDLSLDAEGKTVETIHGPYRNESSIKTYGRFTQEYTRQANAETPQAYAAAILASNSTPERSIRSLSFRVLDAASDFGLGADRRVFLDTDDLVRVVNARAGLDQNLRVAGLKHTIRPERWTVEVDFTQSAGAATPIATAPLPQQIAVQPQIVKTAFGTVNTNGSGDATIVFATPFPNACDGVVVMEAGNPNEYGALLYQVHSGPNPAFFNVRIYLPASGAPYANVGGLPFVYVAVGH